MISVVEYLSQDDADMAVKTLDGREIRGYPVKVSHDVSYSPYFLQFSSSS